MVNKTEQRSDHLGAIIKQARLNMGYSREQLSERIDISVRYLTAIENEQKRPSYDVLYRLIRGLGISANQIFYSKDAEDSESKQLLRLLQQCSERDKKILRATIDSMLDNK